MVTKKGKGDFVKDAMTEQFLERGIDKIYKLSLSTTEEFLNKTKVNPLDPEQTGIENRFIQMSVNLSAESAMKIIKMLNPKRVAWQMGEPPSQKDKEKYGVNARWKWSDFDANQLRLTSTDKVKNE